tara:strand:+ start:773 stop:1000 length:228 start_codon:yes stop_codon:yes gene_type:complete
MGETWFVLLLLVRLISQFHCNLAMTYWPGLAHSQPAGILPWLVVLAITAFCFTQQERTGELIAFCVPEAVKILSP